MEIIRKGVKRHEGWNQSSRGVVKDNEMKQMQY